jgi:hypothetical protein
MAWEKHRASILASRYALAIANSQAITTESKCLGCRGYLLYPEAFSLRGATVTMSFINTGKTMGRDGR